MVTANRGQILDKAVFISYITSTLEKGLNQTIFSPVMMKGRLGYLTLV